MSGRAARPLSAWRWLGAPALACVIATLVLAVPFRVAGFRLPEPVFALAPAFAWAVIRPSLLGPFVLLGLGLFLDLLWGSALGLWGFSVMLAYAGALLGRNLMVGQSPVVLAGWYVGLVALAFASAWLLTVVDLGTRPDPIATLWQMLASVALYPVAAYLIGRFEDEARRL